METYLYSPMGTHSSGVLMGETGLLIEDSQRPVAAFKGISNGLAHQKLTTEALCPFSQSLLIAMGVDAHAEEVVGSGGSSGRDRRPHLRYGIEVQPERGRGTGTSGASKGLCRRVAPRAGSEMSFSDFQSAC